MLHIIVNDDVIADEQVWAGLRPYTGSKFPIADKIQKEIHVRTRSVAQQC